MIRRRCTEGSCKNGRKCLEHLRFDVMYQGNRYRIPANEFAIPRNGAWQAASHSIDGRSSRLGTPLHR
jgi:hypothetical protein